MKLDNPHHNTDQIHIYWNKLRLQETLTPQQLETLQLLGDMGKKQQRQYVIIDDKLVEAPTKQRVYTKTSGEWKRHKSYEKSEKA